MSDVKTVDLTKEEIASAMKACLKTIPYSFSSEPVWLRFEGIRHAVQNKANNGESMGYCTGFKDCALLNDAFPVPDEKREFTDADIDKWAKGWMGEKITAVYRQYECSSSLEAVISAF